MLTLITNVRFARDYPAENFRTFGIVLDIEHDVEVCPEPVFVAANRIEDVETDCANLPTEWQRTIRRTLEVAGSPSMSVGDLLFVTSPSGEELGGWECDARGWSTTDIKRADALLNTHLYHV